MPVTDMQVAAHASIVVGLACRQNDFDLAGYRMKGRRCCSALTSVLKGCRSKQGSTREIRRRYAEQVLRMANVNMPLRPSKYSGDYNDTDGKLARS